MELIDAETLRRTASFEAFPGRAAAAIDYSADGRRLAVAGQGGGVGVWDVESGEQLGALLRAPRGPRTVNPRTVHALAFGQGDLLAAAEVGGAVRIWDVGRRELLRPPLRLPPSVHGLAFSPDGSQLAIPFGALSDEGPNGVEILDVGKRRAGCQAFPRRRGPLGCLLPRRQPARGWRGRRRRAPLGDRRLAAGGTSARSPERVHSRSGVLTGRAHACDLTPVGSAALWDVASQEPIGPPLPAADWGSENWVTARFTPDGARLFVVSDAGRAIRWEVDPDALETTRVRRWAAT